MYTYQLGSNITLNNIFKVTINGYNFDAYNVQNSAALVTATIPTATQYLALNQLVYSSEIIKYRGNIHAKKTVYVERK